MKKVIIFSIFVCLTFLISVNGWALAHFNEPGKQYTIEDEMTGNFIHALQGIKKLTEGKMSVDIKSYKPGLLGIGWSQTGATTLCNFNSGIGEITSGPCYSSISNSGTKNIKTIWTQGSAEGYVAADIYMK